MTQSDKPSTPTSTDTKIEEQIRKILHAPMRSEVSTADIAIGMWSSTMVSEKVHDLKTLLTSEKNKARIEELESFSWCEHEGCLSYAEERIAQLKSTNKNKE